MEGVGHVADVLVVVVVEQEHIAARHDGLGHQLAALRTPGEAHHVAGVGNDEAVKAQLAPQKIGQDLFRKGGGQIFVLLHAGVELLLIGGQHDVAGHQGLNARFDHAPIDLAVGGVPFLAGEGVDAGGDVGVTLVHAVAGEVLHGAEDAALRDAPEVFEGQLQHLVGVVAPGAGGDGGIVPVVGDVHDGGEGPVGAGGFGLPAADLPQLIGIDGVAGGGHFDLLAHVGAVAGSAVAARLHVHRGQDGDLAVGLEEPVHVPHFLGGARVEADAAHLHSGGFLLDGGFVVPCAGQVDEQLLDLLLFGHARDGIFHPGDLLVVQIKGFLGKVDHLLILLAA